MTAGTSAGQRGAAVAAWRAMRAMVLDNDRRREVCDALGMSFIRVKALMQLDQEPRAMAELAAALTIDAPYATVVVDDLETRGLVVRRPHPADRRAKLVATTRSGSAAAARARAVLETPPPGLARLDAEQLRTLVRLLDAAEPRPAGAGQRPGAEPERPPRTLPPP